MLEVENNEQVESPTEQHGLDQNEPGKSEDMLFELENKEQVKSTNEEYEQEQKEKTDEAEEAIEEVERYSVIISYVFSVCWLDILSGSNTFVSV